MAESSRSSAAGSQTLARGLAALKAVVSAPDGVSIQDLGEQLGVHRTIVYRILTTLGDAELVIKGPDGRYRGATGLLGLAAGGYGAFREAAGPVLRKLADRLSSTVSLLVAEGDEAVALSVVEPRNSRYRIVFAEGSRHPLDRGAAGHALQSLRPAGERDADAVLRARSDGYSQTFAEVEPGAHGLAVPVRTDVPGLLACINLITYRIEVIDEAVPLMLAAAQRIASLEF